MAQILLYKKQADKAPKLGKNQIADALKQINRKARVNRDNLVKFMLDGSFNKLSVTPQSVIDSPYRREDEATGWEIPSTELGRIGSATPSAAESVRLWIKQNLSPYGINPDSVSVVFVEGEA